MNFLWDKVTEWLKELLIGSIMSNLTGLFDNVNRQVAGIADNVGATPQAWNGGVFGMIRNLSDNVILPIAGVILALVATIAGAGAVLYGIAGRSVHRYMHSVFHIFVVIGSILQYFCVLFYILV